MGKKRNKRWNSCLMCFVASLAAFGLSLPGLRAEGDGRDGDDNTAFVEASQTLTTDGSNGNRKTIFVSTLDGKLSALEERGDESHLLWSIPADNRPLLSSSISHLEIMENGVSTRYIPSLDGGLYRFDGESIHPVPLSADKLLSASNKISEDTMMVGGKDLVTYGIDPTTGQVRYACGVKGCRKFGEQPGNDEDILIVKRQTQTVRAVDARSGSERWNYSVGQHELSIVQGERGDIDDHINPDGADDVTCSLQDEEDPYNTMESFSNTVKIVVPEGMVVGVSPDNHQGVKWTHKFSSPITSVWLWYKGELQQLDLFGNANIPALSSFSQDAPINQPLLYVGFHNKQLYVQQSDRIKDKVLEAAEKFKADNLQETWQSTDLPRVAWRPYLNTAQWRTPTMNNHRTRPQIEAHPSGGTGAEQCDEVEDKGLIIWHENYPFDNGFYLYPEFTIIASTADDDDNYCFGDYCPSNQSQESTIYDDVMAVPVTLWYYWKEVVAISVVTSLVLNIILMKLKKAHDHLKRSLSSSQSFSESGSSNEQSVRETEGENSPPSRQNSDEYVSRYEADYKHIQVLGKGGFGVVFEAMNKVDECHYAIKRIALPNSKGAKEKMMREVKSLAKLEHVGIVRYFHTWIESPPPGWQEDKDSKLEYSEGVTSMTFSPFSSDLPTDPLKGTPTKSEFPSTSLSKSSPETKSSPLDFLKNAFGNNNIGFSEVELKRGSSEEFSVRNISESGWGNTNSTSGWDDNNLSSLSQSGYGNDDEESGSFSGMGTPNFPEISVNDDSVDISFRHETDDEATDCDKSSDVNTNNKCTLSIPKTEQTSNSVPFEESNNSIQILFEDSGCADKSLKGSVDELPFCHFLSRSVSQLASLCSETESNTNTNPTFTKSHRRSRSGTHGRSKSLGQMKDFHKITSGTSTKDLKSKSEQSMNSGHKPKLFLYIQMQLCRRETLKDWLALNTLNRDRHTVLDIFDQITSAIDYVHDTGLMHRDLKPSNIFFSIDGVIKMGDFGLVTALHEEQTVIQQDNNPFRKHTAQVGTQLYMSPEQLRGKKYSQKVDIFSLGVILFELLYPFATSMERVSTLVKVKEQLFPERFNREMQKESKFVKWLLAPKPEDRPTAKEILSSELLREFENRRIPQRFRTRTVSQNSN